MANLKEVLNQNVREAAPELCEKLDRNRVRCFSCGHCCPIADGQAGVCKVRFNQGGTLQVPWGYVGGVQCDPIEKKPFFHAYSGALAYSFGMLGCDLHCSYCQNWVTSQALRDPHAVSAPLRVTPETLVREAVNQGARLVVSTYNEPLITAEWAVAIFKEAKAAGLATAFVSNGNATPQVLDYLRPWIDLYKVDLKSFDEQHYHQLGGRLQPILETIRRLHAMGIWVEIVTLVIPGFNDSDDELKRLAGFLAEVSTDLPWHVTAFHGDYKMTEPEDTTARIAGARGGDRTTGRTALHLCGQSSGGCRRSGKYPLLRLPRIADRTFWIPDHAIPFDLRRALPEMRQTHSGALGYRIPQADQFASVCTASAGADGSDRYFLVRSERA